MTVITVYPGPSAAVTPIDRPALTPTGKGVAVGVFRLPSDPLYLAAVTLENIVIGSRYRLVNNADLTELATGIASSTTEVIINVPAYTSDMLIRCKVRNSSNAPYYKEFLTYVHHTRNGVIIWIAQELDS